MVPHRSTYHFIKGPLFAIFYECLAVVFRYARQF
jgi:hypothetical protein